MVAAVSESSLDQRAYYALRICPEATADAFWREVRRRRDVPPAISALAHGRTRVELTRDEAGAALTWAERIDGWTDAQPKPLHVYPAA